MCMTEGVTVVALSGESCETGQVYAFSSESAATSHEQSRSISPVECEGVRAHLNGLQLGQVYSVNQRRIKSPSNAT